MSPSPLDELRAAFDEAFARDEPAPEPTLEDFLEIRAGSIHCALRLVEIAYLCRAPRITPVVGRLPELRGLCSMRGAIVPVFDLGGLLGQPIAREAPAWLASCGGSGELAIGFASVERQLRVPGRLLRRLEGSRERHVVEQIPDARRALPVIELRSLVARCKGESP